MYELPRTADDVMSRTWVSIGRELEDRHAEPEVEIELAWLGHGLCGKTNIIRDA